MYSGSLVQSMHKQTKGDICMTMVVAGCHSGSEGC
jgi:hypothetical protein